MNSYAWGVFWALVLFLGALLTGHAMGASEMRERLNNHGPQDCKWVSMTWRGDRYVTTWECSPARVGGKP